MPTNQIAPAIPLIHFSVNLNASSALRGISAKHVLRGLALSPSTNKKKTQILHPSTPNPNIPQIIIVLSLSSPIMHISLPASESFLPPSLYYIHKNCCVHRWLHPDKHHPVTWEEAKHVRCSHNIENRSSSSSEGSCFSREHRCSVDKGKVRGDG